jgi:hypothetical protein
VRKFGYTFLFFNIFEFNATHRDTDPACFPHHHLLVDAARLEAEAPLTTLPAREDTQEWEGAL